MQQSRERGGALGDLEARPAPQLSPRLLAAVIAGKGAGAASRVLGRGGGTSLPGLVAERLAPGLLGALVGRSGSPVVAITGSNGKTTTARLLAALLRGEGVAVTSNTAGSNMAQGVRTLAIEAVDLRGRLPEGVLVAEVDEGALPLVAAQLRPRALLVTDVFRDQLDRYGEMHAVAHAIETVARALPSETGLVINGDDPLVADMARQRAGDRVTFGFDLPRSTDRLSSAADSVRCPRCRSPLEYAHVYLSHLGDYRCVACGFSRPALDVAVTDLELAGLGETRMTVRTPAGSTRLSIPQGGVHIAYDAAAALATCLALRVRVPHAHASLAGVGPAFGRLEQIDAPGRRVVLAFAKNPTSFNATLGALATEGEPRHLLAAFSYTPVDGEDFGWLWDVDAEGIAGSLAHVTAAGLRADEIANRFKYAGVDPRRIDVVTDLRGALDAALAEAPAGAALTIVAGYTPTIRLREEMRRRGWVGRYWRA